MRDAADKVVPVGCCWTNAVKHGFVEMPEDWPSSSTHRDTARGIAEPVWSGIITDGAYGEQGG